MHSFVVHALLFVAYLQLPVDEAHRVEAPFCYEERFRDLRFNFKMQFGRFPRTESRSLAGMPSTKACEDVHA